MAFGVDFSPYEESTRIGEVWESYKFYAQLLANDEIEIFSQRFLKESGR